MSSRKSILSMMALEPRIMFDGAGAADLAGKTNWTAVLRGESLDFSGDTQAGKANLDLVGNVDHAVLYTNFDNNDTTSDASDDKLSFRLRIGNPTDEFSAVALVGIDVTGDCGPDIYVGVDGRNNGQAITIWMPDGLNTSPDTVGITKLDKNLSLPSGNKGGVYDFTSTNYQFTSVSSTSDSEWNGVTDIDQDGKTDKFVSFEVSFADIVSVLSTEKGLTITKDSTLSYTAMTLTQNNSLNGDLGGVSGNLNSSDSFNTLKACSAQMTAATPVEARAGGTPYGSIDDQTFSGTGDWNFTFSDTAFTDPDGDPMTYTVNLVTHENVVIGDGSLPSWLSFNASTRTFSGNPPSGTELIYLRVMASDGNTTGEDMFSLTITEPNDAPVLDATKSPTLTAINEDVTAPTGGTVASIIVDGSITDGDASTATEAIAVTAVDNANGTWQFSTDGSTWTAFGTPTAIASRLLDATHKIRFIPNTNYNGTATITFRAWDKSTGTAGGTANTSTNGSGTAYSTATDTASITVNPINDAPLLSDQTPSLSNIAEGNQTSSGNTVAQIVDDSSITEVTLDNSAVEAIAVTAVVNTNGSWEYSIDGSTWVAFGTPTEAAARLLDTTSKIRFVPNTDYVGTATITFRAWDKTTGTVGDTADTSGSNNGGTTAFSTAIDTASITVTAVNDSPVLDNSTSPTMTAIDEDNQTSAGDLISAIVGTTITDADSGAAEGIAITGLVSTNGTWQSNVSGSWADIGTVSGTSAFLMRATDKIRFVPNTNFNGTATFTYRAWDTTSGSAGDKVSVSTNGSATAFSSVEDTATITVNPINDAPLLADQTPTLTAIDEDNTTSSGNSVAGIVVDSSITEVTLDNAAIEAIAVTAVDNTKGAWQYSTDNGENWTAFGTPSDSAARLLDSTAKIRFVPNADYNGTATITFRAWDKTSGTAGGTADTSGSNNGETTAFSTATDTASITVNAVNDTPALTNIDGDSLTYTVGSAATILDQSTAAGVTDGSGENFNTGTLTVSVAANNVSGEDVLAIKNVGTGSGQIGVSGSNVTYEGTVIGTFTGGSSGSDLVITFNTSATTTSIAVLAQNITYRNSDTSTPTGSDRTVRFTLTDGDGGTSNSADVTISIAPTLSIAASSASLVEGNSGNQAFTFTVTRAVNTTAATTVNYAVTGSGTNAAVAADFGGTLPSGTVSFAAGETTKTVTINVNGDTTNENDEGFTVTLSSASGGATILTATATGTISNDDGNNSVNVHDGAVQLDGSNDNVALPSITGLTGAFTIEAWVYVDNYDTTNKRIVSMGSSDTTYADAVILQIQATTGKVQLFTGAVDATLSSITTDNAISTGQWVHVAAVTDGTANGAAIYFNGVAQNIGGSATATLTGATTATRTDGAIGASHRSGDNNYLKGMIDEVRIWNTARTSTDIAANDDQQTTGSETSLLAYYRFDDNAAGTAIDDYTSSNLNGTLTNGARIVNTLGKALSFDGTNDIIDFGTGNGTFAFNGTAFTLETWIKTSSTSSQQIFSKDATGSSDGTGRKLLFLDASGQLTFANDTTFYADTTALNDNQWHHVAATYDNAGTLKLYVDGSLVKTSTGVTISADDAAHTNSIGVYGNGQYFNGQMDNFRYWSADKSADIATLYNQTLSGTHTGLVVNLPFDEIVSTKVDDDAGTNTQGTVSGATAVNTAPIIYGNPLSTYHLIVQKDESGSGYMTTNDVSGTPTFSVKTAAVNGTVNIDSTSGSWTYTPNSGYVGTDQFTISVYGSGDITVIDSETVIIKVDGTAPVTALSASGNAVQTFTENGNAVVIDSALDVTGFTSQLTGATVSITSNFQSGVDVLGFTDQNGITGSYNASTGVLTLTGTTTSANYQTALRSITFSNTSDAPSTSTRTVTVTADGKSLTKGVNVVAVNDAPVLADQALTLTAINEGNQTSGGDLVSAVVGTAITDVDTGAVEGIAITALDETNGTWQSNVSGSWANIGTVANDSALLLRATDKVRFVPNTNYNGTATFTFRAWDTTSGTAGNKVTTAPNGGTTAFSTATDTASITVNAVNDAPVLSISGNPTLTTIAEDVTDPNGDFVSAIVIDGSVTEASGDSAAIEAIAVTSVVNTNGAWQYSTDGGDSWTAFGSVDASTARLLDSTAKIRFVPTANYNGTATFTYRAWDKTSGTAGSTANITATGDATAFSANEETATITVTAVNDAPILDDAQSPTLTAINEDNTTSGGDTVATIVVDSSITEVANDNTAVEAIAVTAVDNTNGIWQYSADGSTWTDFGTPTETASRLLDSTYKIRFIPNANWNGTANITFRAWDKTSGTIAGQADTTSNGGTTAFSAASDTASITVNAQNDAPVLDNTKSPVLTAIDEDNKTSSGDTVASIIVDDSITDLGGAAFEAIAVTAVDNTNGAWQYDTGSGWTAFGSVDASTARLLDSTAKIRFVPNDHYNGTATITFRAWDKSTGSSGGTANITATGDATAFSSATDTASITVNAINDAPVLDNTQSPTLTTINEDVTAPTGDTVEDIVVNSSITEVALDNTAVEAIAVTAVDNARGTWQFSTNNGSSWTDFGSPSGTSSRLLDTAHKIRFIPNSNYNGSATITFRAWDKTSGTAGGTADTSTNGGTTAFSSATDTASITISAVNDAPRITAVSVASDLNTTYTFSDTDFSNSFNDDLDSGSLSSIQITSFPNASTQGTLTLNGTTITTATTITTTQLSNGELKFVPANGVKGTTSFNWKGSDGTAFSDAGTASVLINGTAPTVDKGIDNQTFSGGGAWNFTIPSDAFEDLDGDTLSYTVQRVDSSGALVNSGSLPSWLSFDGVTRIFNGDPPNSFNGQTLYFKVTASDATKSATDTFSLGLGKVNTPPVVNDAMDDQKTTGEGTWSYQVPKYTFTDADGDTLTYSASLTNGDPLPSWLTFDASTRTFKGNAPGSLSGTTLNLRVYASDGKASTYDDVGVQFVSVNDPVRVLSGNEIPDQTFDGPGDWTYQVPDTVFIDNDGETLTYSVQLVDASGNLVNGGTLPSWLTFTASTRTFSGNPPPSLNNTSLYFKVTGTDGYSSSDNDTFKLSITNANDTPTGGNLTSHDISVGDTWTYTFASDAFSDLDTGTTLSYSATQSDGSALPAWLLFNTSTRTFSFSGDGKAPSGTAYVNIKVTASDGSGGTKTSEFKLSIDQGTTASTPTKTAISNQTHDGEGNWNYQIPSNTFNDADGNALTLSAQYVNSSDVLIGDGSLPSWLTFTASTRSFSGNPPPSLDSSTLRFKVTATDGTAVSSSFNLTITNANDAPVLDKAQSPTLTAIDEDNKTSAGTLVSDMVVNNSITDLDTGAVESIAVTAVDNANGAWQYTTDGSTWTAFGTPSISSARLLDAANKIRFVPNTDWNGTATITFRAWDKNTGTIGSTANTTTNGAGTAFSTAYDTASITVNAVNDVPTIYEVTKSVNEDNTLTFASTDFSKQYKDVEGSSLSQIKVIAVPTNGILKLSGTTLANGATISLANIANLTYTPNTNYNGNDTFTWQGYDGAAYSATNNVNIAVKAVNDAPILADQAPVLTAINEDTSAPSGDTIATIVVNSSITEVANDNTAIEAIAVTAVDNTNGTWQYSTNKGTDWTAFGTPSETAARLLDSDDKIRFIPKANYNGSAPTITYRAWDKTSGSGGGTADTSGSKNGGTTAFSTATDTASITINPVQDLPTVSNFRATVVQGKNLVLGTGRFDGAFTDLDGDSLSQIQITSLPDAAYGQLKLAGAAVSINDSVTRTQLNVGQLVFAANADVVSETTFNWKGHDGTAYSTASGTGTIQITEETNSPPPPKQTVVTKPPLPPEPGNGGGLPLTTQVGLTTQVRQFSLGDGGSFGNESRVATVVLGDGGSGTGGVESFRVAVIADTGGLGGESRDGKSLVVFKGIADYLPDTQSNSVFYTVPPDAFAHTESDAAVQLRATLANGEALPNWLNFDTNSGTFSGEAPQGFSGNIELLVTARDSIGLQASAQFRIVVGSGSTIETNPLENTSIDPVNPTGDGEQTLLDENAPIGDQASFEAEEGDSVEIAEKSDENMDAQFIGKASLTSQLLANSRTGLYSRWSSIIATSKEASNIRIT